MVKDIDLRAEIFDNLARRLGYLAYRKHERLEILDSVSELYLAYARHRLGSGNGLSILNETVKGIQAMYQEGMDELEKEYGSSTPYANQASYDFSNLATDEMISHIASLQKRNFKRKSMAEIQGFARSRLEEMGIDAVLGVAYSGADSAAVIWELANRAGYGIPFEVICPVKREQGGYGGEYLINRQGLHGNVLVIDDFFSRNSVTIGMVKAALDYEERIDSVTFAAGWKMDAGYLGLEGFIPQ
jgi:hypothetical protein